jgi:hypothetical protein
MEVVKSSMKYREVSHRHYFYGYIMLYIYNYIYIYTYVYKHQKFHCPNRSMIFHIIGFSTGVGTCFQDDGSTMFPKPNLQLVYFRLCHIICTSLYIYHLLKHQDSTRSVVTYHQSQKSFWLCLYFSQYLNPTCGCVSTIRCTNAFSMILSLILFMKFPYWLGPCQTPFRSPGNHFGGPRKGIFEKDCSWKNSSLPTRG